MPVRLSLRSHPKFRRPAAIPSADATRRLGAVKRRVIDLHAVEPQPRVLEVHGVGRCVVCSPTLRAHLRLAGHLDGNPFRVDQGRCVDELISVCVREPRLTPAAVRRLPAPACRRLRLGALEAAGVASDYRRLRGSHLTADERAYAALRWRADRRRVESERLMRSLRDRPVPDIPPMASRLVELAQTARTAPWRDAIESAQGWSRPLDLLFPSLSKTLHFDPSATTKFGTFVTSQMARAAEALRGGQYRRTAFAVAQRRYVDELVSGFDVTSRIIRELTGTFDVRRTLPKPWHGFEQAHRLDSAAFAAAFDPGIRRAAQMLTQNVDKMVSQQVRSGSAPLGGFDGVMELLRRERPVLVVVEDLLPRWKQRPLAVLVDLVSVRGLAALMQLEVEGGTGVVVDALTPAVTEEEVLDAVAEGVENAGYIEPYSREWLREALNNLRQHPRRWVLAVGHLVLGVEGAFRDGARQAGLVDWSRRDKQVIVENGKHVDAVERLFGHLGLEPSHDLFLRSQAYGGRGNAIRHASVRDQSSPEAARRQVTVLLLALAMGLEHFGDRRAMRMLLASVEWHARRLSLLLPDL